MVLRRIDIVIIILCIAGIVLTSFIFRKANNNLILVVYVGREKKIYSLNDADFTVKGENNWVKVRVRDGKVKITESSCNDKCCVNMGAISSEGQSLVCLPGRIFVTIEKDRMGEQRDNNSFDALTR